MNPEANVNVNTNREARTEKSEPQFVILSVHHPQYTTLGPAACDTIERS